MVVTVIELLHNPFANRTRQEKVAIILEGKPRPVIENLSTVHTVLTPGPSTSYCTNPTAFNKYDIYFDPVSYDHIEWLTGCEIRRQLYCWPCILFRSAHQDCWNKVGLSDLSNFGEKIRSHEITLLHIQSMLDLNLFISSIKDEEKPAPISKNENLEKNRKIVKQIIDVICFLATQQNDQDTDSRIKNVLEVEDVLENLNFLRNYDVPETTNFTDQVIETVEKSPNLVADMIEAINSAVKKAIQTEVRSSTYVSIILSEHSIERSKSQISIVLRYLRDGEVCERFVGFENIEELKTSNFVYKLINKVVTDFQVHMRLIAYSLDGSVLLNMAALYELNRELKYRYPRILFVPCHFHNLEDVLIKSLSSSNECDLFFKLIMCLESYLPEGADCLKFESNKDYELSNLDNPPANPCINYPAYLNNIKIKRLSILKEFNDALDNFQRLTDDDIIKIRALRTFLTEFKNIFLLEVLLKLFDDVSPLTEEFKNPFPGLAFDTKLIKYMLESLVENIKSSEVEKFWFKFVQEFCEGEKFTSSSFVAKKESCCKLLTEIMLCIRNQIKFRFDNSSKLNFSHILDFETSAKSLSEDDVQLLISTYGKVFEYAQLRKEIKMLNENKSALTCESVHKLYKFFITSNLRMSFKNINRMCELVLSLPSTVPNANKSATTKLDEINLGSYSSCKEHIQDVSLLSIERNYIEELKTNESFYNDIISEFYKVNKTLELE